MAFTYTQETPVFLNSIAYGFIWVCEGQRTGLPLGTLFPHSAGVSEFEELSDISLV